MAFPFPLNPVDGQQVSQTQPDGSVLVATYHQAKNEWEVNRQLPAPTPLTGTPPINVAATADGQVITWDQALNTWVAKAPAVSSGGTGGTYSKATQAGPDTPNPPDPTKPTVTLKPGMLQTTLENLHKELKAWNGSTWAEVFSEDTIKTWISAGSLFRGVVKEATLSTLPAPATANRGYYYSWTGNPGHVVAAGDAAIGGDLLGEVLQVGDWIQSDGSKWVHVPGDLLSKQRWDSLGSFAPWSDTSWEKGSVVSYQKSFFRANALISPGDLAPDATGSKWTDITPLPSIKLAQLADVNDNAALSGEDGVLVWSEVNGEFVVSRDITVDGIEFDATGPGAVLEGLMNGNLAANKTLTTQVPSCEAVATYVDGLRVEDLLDAKGLNVAADGEFIAWDDVSNGWLPKKAAAAIAGMTDVDLTTPPTQGQTLLYNAVGTKWSAGTLTLGDLGNVDLTTNPPSNGDVLFYDGGTPSNWKPLKLGLGVLSDVALTGTADNQILKYDLASTSWQNWTPDFLNTTNGYTKTEVDNKLTALVTGLEHEISVLAIADTPPASPTLDQVYIVGATPTGVWSGQSNNLARWDGAAWVFDAPRNKEAHLVEAELATYSWNGTNWVKVATASTSGSAAAGDIWTVGSIQQSILTEAQWATALGAEASKWAFADGRNVTGSKYATLTGNNTIPDLRGAFMRMAGKNAAKTSWDGGTLATFQEDTTRIPRYSAFTTDQRGNHHHAYNDPLSNAAGTHRPGVAGSDVYNAGEVRLNPGRNNTTDNGAHTHAIQGGDAETRPKTYAVNYFIKIN